MALEQVDFFLSPIRTKRFNPMTLQFKVPNMACSACSETITKAIQAVDPIANVQADPKTKLVNIETQAAENAIKEAVTAAGYTVE